MTDDVQRLLREADGGPSTPDLAHIQTRGRRLTWIRRGALAGGASVLAIGLIAVVASLPSSPPAPVIGDASPAPSPPTPETTDVCDRPDLSPTYLPWLEQGDAVPGPAHVTAGTTSSPDALTVWAKDPGEFDPDAAVQTDTLTVATLAEPIDVDDSATQVEVLGHPAQLQWIGDPGTGGVQLSWQDDDRPCGSHALTLTINHPADYLDIPAEGESGNTDAASQPQLQTAIEAELVRIAESLRAHPASPTSQLPPSDGGPELDDQQLEQVVEVARESVEVAEVLATSHVAETFVQAGDGEAFGADRVAWVAFSFDQPHDPGVFPWDGMCDIDGRTDDWLGVVARLDLGDDDAVSSPLWTTGANCVNWSPGDHMPFDVRPM